MTHEPPKTLGLQSAWYRIALASIGDGVITTDTAGRVAFLNAAAEMMTGWTSEDAVGQPFPTVFRAIHEGSREPVDDPTAHALRDGVVTGLAKHCLLVARDGTERSVDDSAAPIRDDDGQVGGVVLVFRDVSERRRQEVHVRDALAYAENIIATLREPLVVLDDTLRIQMANRAFYQQFQVGKDETEGRFIYDVGDGQWSALRLRAMLQGVAGNGDSFDDFEVEHGFPTIGRRIMLLHARPFESTGVGPNLVLLAFEDVTEHRQAALAMLRSEGRYRRLFQATRDGIIILDIGTLKITDANPFMTELLGFSRDEILGKELWELGFFGDKPASQVAYRELERLGYVRYDHLPLKTKTGHKAEVEFISNVYELDGRKVAQCSIRDISARSRVERKMEEQAASLADLHRRKDEFLSTLGHELRNPLAPILNSVLLLQLQRNESPIQRQAVGIIERQVGRLSRIIDDLLEVSRIATGRVPLRREAIAIAGIVVGAVDMVTPLIEQHEHELNVMVPDAPIVLDADPARLEQVLVTLLTNAAMYTANGGHISLTVGQEGDECVVRVQDDGEGISPEALPYIFDLFSRAEHALDRPQGGLGIGLALAQRLVRMHRGDLDATSTPGQGSEFIVRLPIARTPAADTRPGEVRRPPDHALRVLVVEDNLDTAQSLTLLLESSGHDVQMAHDGQRALELALEHRPNVVLLDIGLPGIDGYKVAKWMRHRLKDVVLVAVTGHGLDADRARAREAGFNHHLVKPADFTKLQQILADIPYHPK